MDQGQSAPVSPPEREGSQPRQALLTKQADRGGDEHLERANGVFGQRVRESPQCLVSVTCDTRPVQLTNPVEAFGGTGTVQNQVAPMDDEIGMDRIEVVLHSIKGGQVSVHIGYDRQLH